MSNDRIKHVMAKAREVDAIDTEIKNLLVLRLNKYLDDQDVSDLDEKIETLLQKQEAIVQEITDSAPE